jgi:hypothetical protein
VGSLPRRHLMLTPNFPWNDLFYELKFETAIQLVQHDNFPQSILQFGLSSIENYTVANEKLLWKYVIKFYFPAIEANKEIQTQSDPKTFFISLYQKLTSLLNANGLSFSDYVKAVLHKTSVASHQMPTLQGLLLSTGIGMFDFEAPSQAVLDQALIFSAVLGNTHFFNTHYEPQPAAFNRDCASQALVLAARTGHHRIFHPLLHNAIPPFDATTLRNALLTAAEEGHIRMVAPLLQAPFSRLLSFSLKRVVELAISRNYPELLVLVLRANQQQRFGSEIRCGVVEAAERNLDGIIAKTYQLAPAQFNDYTICKLVKIAAIKGNMAIISLFVQHPALLKSPSTLLESAKEAMTHEHVSIALLLLQHCRAGFRVYVKRDLFLLAVQLGQLDIVEDYLKNDDLKADRNFFENARQIAAFHEHPSIEIVLQAKIGTFLIDKENNIRTNERVDSFTQAFSKLSLSEVHSQYTPAYLAHKLRTSDVIEKQPSASLKAPVL